MPRRQDNNPDKGARLNKLTELGAERLAEALLSLADQTEEADDLVHRMVATSKETEDKFRANLAALKRMQGMGDWRASHDIVGKLRRMLEDLRAGVKDSRAGIEHMAAFYKTDEWVFNHYDDSNGNIGDVYRYDARDLFILYALRCPDKEWLSDVVLKLYQDDGYGVRDRLLDSAGDYLPESVMRSMVERLWAMSKNEDKRSYYRHSTFGIEALARQLKDPKLYEKARRTATPELPVASCTDIAQAYFESGDVKTPLSWLERIPANETYMSLERDELLAQVYEKLGDPEKQAEAAWRIFRSGRSKDALTALLQVIGEEKREEVIDGETATIMQSELLAYNDVIFLMQVGRIDDAEAYLFARVNKLKGDSYHYLLPLAQGMEKHGRLLMASIICRALIDSILRKGIAKYYHHAVRYMNILERLAASIADWRSFTPHADYMAELRQNHKRKTSLWAKFGE